MAKTFRDWNVEQSWLLPPSVMDFVPADHLAHFIRDTVREQLDLSAILAPYEQEERGYPPYHPVMMTALLLYGYCQGIYSSRRIARGCEERVDFMAVTGLNRPDFRTVSEFRKRHLEALKGLHASRRGDELPDWVANKQRRIEKIREAKAALEAEACAQGEATPKPKAQRNFTDAQSRIMKTGSDFVQAYNGQAAVDADSQVIVAQNLSNMATDVQQLASIFKQIKINTARQARELSADAGYCSAGNLAGLARHNVKAYVARGRQRHNTASATGQRARGGKRVTAMRTTLARTARRSRYRLRKQTVEPVFGQIKQARGFRQFLMRGLAKVQGEWSLICTVHNLLKLAKASRTP